MADYDFSTLNGTDLEELTCDLLNADLPTGSVIKYKTFKEGKDKGIDFLYSTETNAYEHVGQVKHYYRTGYDGLIYTLKNSEVAKAKMLKPTKYILATSLDLSVSNTEEIKTIFAPYILSLNDIYGKKDLNRLIEEHEEILKQHYKLWLSDSSILKLILNSDLEFRSSSFIENELKRRIRIYVKTNLFDVAREALRKNKYIILTGEPGVGKTTLAEMLIYEYLAEGYSLTYIIDDIKEAERTLVKAESKQIIYFDDFLGSTQVEIEKAKGGEPALRALLRALPKMKNKLLILTTRAFLLKSAMEESENLRKIELKTKASLFELTEYDVQLKKQLLINHIEDSELNESLKSIFYTEDVINFIVSHKNFTPRSVEFITSIENVGEISEGEFRDFICSSIEYPDKIWQHAYCEQIGENERLLLNTLLSFGDSANIKELERAFINRVEYEVAHNNKTKVMFVFHKSFKRLEGGFIIVKNNKVNFINPSLIDFLMTFLLQDKGEILKMAETITFASQLTERFFSLSRKVKIEMPAGLQERLINDYSSFVRGKYQDFDLIQIALVINKYIKNPLKNDVLYKIVEEVEDWESLYSNYELNLHFREFALTIDRSSRVFGLINSRKQEIMNELVLGLRDLEESIRTLENIASNFEVDFSLIDTSSLKRHFDYIFSELISSEIEDLMEWITDEGEATIKKEEIINFVNRLNEIGFDYKLDLSEFDIDWFDIAMNNEFRRVMEKDD